MVGRPGRGASGGSRSASTEQLRSFKADLFKALAHPARIKILDLLRDRSLTVSALQAELGIEPSSVSQQLAVLRAKYLVDGRREGASVHYTVRDAEVFGILDSARRIFDNHLVELRAIAGEDEPDAAAAN